MKTERTTIRIDAVRILKEMSRDRFATMRRERRINDKRHKPPKHRKQEEEL